MRALLAQAVTRPARGICPAAVAVMAALSLPACDAKRRPVRRREGATPPETSRVDASPAEPAAAPPEEGAPSGGPAAAREPEPIPSPKEWRVMECPEADRGPAELFAPGRSIASFDTGLGGWKAISGGQQARAKLALDTREKHEGAASLRVDFEFTGDKELEYVNLGHGFAIPERGSGLGMMVKTDGTDVTFRVRIADKSGETHQLDLIGNPGKSWSFVGVMFDGHSGSWGGDGNRRLDYPCRFQSIVADRPRKGYRGTGSLWIDRVVTVSERTFERKISVEVGDARFGNLYAPGESVHVRARASSGRLRWRLEDYWGTAIARGEADAADADASFRPRRQGFYRVTFELVEDGLLEEGRVFRCAAMAGARSSAPPAGNDLVAFCSHFRWNAYPIECMELMRSYSFRRFRDEIPWSGVEAKRGTYALPGFGATMIERAGALGMSPLLILDYANPHYDKGGFPNSDEAIAGYAAYGENLARLTRGVVGEMEIWNEWIGGCGMGGKPGDHSPEAYGCLLKTAHARLKAAFPDLTVVGMGGFCVRPFPKMVARAISTSGPGAMDAISIHPYRYPRAPEESDLVGEVMSVADKAGELGSPRKLWITEIGWPTFIGSRGVDERTQARYIVRTMALLQSTKVVERVYWYDFKNDGMQREYNEHNFGVVYHQKFNCAPKPAVAAASVFARMTAEAEAVGLWHDDDRYALLCRRSDGRSVVVAWAVAGTHEATFSGTVTEVRDTMGNALPADSRVMLSPDPVYVVGENLAVDGR